MKRLALALICAASPVAAMDDLEVLQAASALGGILASEEFCGLTFDQAAISAYITKNIPPERMDFAQNLQMQVMGQEYIMKDMKPSAKTAHCTSIAQTAKHYGFTK